MPDALHKQPAQQAPGLSTDSLLALPVRRTVMLHLAASAWLAGGAMLRVGSAQAQTANSTDGAAPDLKTAIERFTGGRPLQRGKVQLDVATLIDNGNTVPVRVVVDHPMQATAHVRAIALFAERNPQHEVGEFWLSPTQGVAEVATRIRLATTQRLTAIAALSDGSFWFDELELLVTLAACIEGD